MITIIPLKNKVTFFHIDMKQHLFDYKTKMNILFFNFNCYFQNKLIIFYFLVFIKFIFYKMKTVIFVLFIQFLPYLKLKKIKKAIDK